MEQHNDNIKEYINRGGDKKIIERYTQPTLSNRAKVMHLLSTLPNVAKSKKITQKVSPTASTPTTNTEIQQPKNSKPKGLGLIAQYPIELHEIYQQALGAWVKICTMKMELNLIPKSNEEEAFLLQTEMLDTMQNFDKCKNALEYYLDNNMILPTKKEFDFSDLSPTEKVVRRNSLRSGITRRRQTIEKYIAGLPDKGALDYFKKKAAINKKQISLQEVILEEIELSKIIKQGETVL